MIEIIITEETIEYAKQKLNIDGSGEISIDDNFDSLESSVTVFAHKALSFSENRSISRNIEAGIEAFRLKDQGLSRELLNEIKSRVNLSTVMLTGEGGEKSSSTEISTAFSLIGGLLIYFFIFLYGSMVMRGVMEEKSNRQKLAIRPNGWLYKIILPAITNVVQLYPAIYYLAPY